MTDRYEWVKPWLAGWVQHYQNRPAPLRALFHTELANLQAIVQRLDRPIVTIACFGLVSRGKSAVCNALLGERRLTTGAVHGVTRWPRSLRWQETDHWAVDLVDTPGLDEVAGESRQEMTEAIVEEADLLLLVSNGVLNTQELAALATIAGQKPLFLVCNKMDLHTAEAQETIVAQVREQISTLLAQEQIQLTTAIPILPVAAEPLPRRVQVEWPDGRITETWETPPPQIAPLEIALQEFLHTTAIVAFRQHQHQQAEPILDRLAQQTLAFYQTDSDRLQQRFLQGRMLWVGICPWVGLDVMGAFILDLLLIRSLDKLYQFPRASPIVHPLWQAMLQNLTLLVAIEWGFHSLGSADLSLLGLEGWGVLVVQVLWAGYGSDRIGRAARRYLSLGYIRNPNS